MVEGQSFSRNVGVELLLHELGHNLGLDFGGEDSGHTHDGHGLMGANMNGSFSIDSKPLNDVYQSMPVTGTSGEERHRNTQERIRKFFENNRKKYDEPKAKKSGI